MAVCTRCGAQLAPGARVCPHDGAPVAAPLEDAQTLVSPSQGPGPAPAPWSPSPSPSPGAGARGGTPPWLIGILIAAVVALALGVGFLLASRARDDTADGGITTVATMARGASSSTTQGSVVRTPAPSSDTSTATVPQTAVTAPPTTAPAFPGLAAGASSDTVASMATATQLAGAYADGDWTTVRRLNPSRASRSDSELASAYGDLDASTPVWVAGGGAVPLRLGLVAHQTRSGSQLTTIYCVSWSVDVPSATVYEDGSRADTLRSTSGWVDPASLVVDIQSRC